MSFGKLMLATCRDVPVSHSSTVGSRRCLINFAPSPFFIPNSEWKEGLGVG